MKSKIMLDGENRQCHNIVGEEERDETKEKKKVRVGDIMVQWPSSIERTCVLGRRSRTFCPLPSLARASSPDLLSGTTSFSSHPQLNTDDQRCVIPFILGIISYPRKYSHHASRNYWSKIIPPRTLLVAQWLTLCLPMQGVHV